MVVFNNFSLFFIKNSSNLWFCLLPLSCNILRIFNYHVKNFVWLIDREQSSKVIREALLLFLFLLLLGGGNHSERNKTCLQLNKNHDIEMPCVALYGFVWPCMAVYGRAWPCMALYGRVWPCMMFINLEWCLVALYGFSVCSIVALYRLFSRS